MLRIIFYVVAIILVWHGYTFSSEEELRRSDSVVYYSDKGQSIRNPEDFLDFTITSITSFKDKLGLIKKERSDLGQSFYSDLRELGARIMSYKYADFKSIGEIFLKSISEETQDVNSISGCLDILFRKLQAAKEELIWPCARHSS